VIAHDEVVARQPVQRLLQLRRLRDGEITGVDHAHVLTLQQRLSGRTRQEGEGLGQHQREGGRQQPIEHADDARRRILLDGEHCPDPGSGRHSVFDRLGTEEQACGSERMTQRTARQRDAPPFAVDEERQILEQRGTPGITAAVGPQRLRLVARK